MNKTSVALGTFDGLHRGHIQVIKNAVETGERLGLSPVVMLFDEHPLSVIKGFAPPKLIDDGKRREIISSLKAETVRVRFSDIVNLSKDEFFSSVLLDKLNARAVCCGENFRFGKNAEGDVDFLREECKKSGIEICVAPIVTIDGDSISSTRIRSLISEGQIEKANEMLGRRFSYSSVVLDGKHLGRKLGIPTVNQLIPSGLVTPKKGVYASYTLIDGKRYKSITNIGVRPTVENTLKVNSETHILSFSGNLYGKSPEIELARFIRDEIKFDSVSRLREQIEMDINTVKNL